MLSFIKGRPAVVEAGRASAATKSVAHLVGDDPTENVRPHTWASLRLPAASLGCGCWTFRLCRGIYPGSWSSDIGTAFRTRSGHARSSKGWRMILSQGVCWTRCARRAQDVVDVSLCCRARIRNNAALKMEKGRNQLCRGPRDDLVVISVTHHDVTFHLRLAFSLHQHTFKHGWNTLIIPSQGSPRANICATGYARRDCHHTCSADLQRTIPFEQETRPKIASLEDDKVFCIKDGQYRR